MNPASLPSYIGAGRAGYLGFPRPDATREAFLVVLGAWNPAGPPPAGMPVNAINLAALGAVTEIAIISKRFPPAWAGEAFAREEPGVAFAPSNITLDFGTPAAPTLYAAGVTPEAIGDTLNYPSPTVEQQVQMTVHASAGNLGDLTAGRATLAIYMGRWPATIGRFSP